MAGTGGDLRRGAVQQKLSSSPAFPLHAHSVAETCGIYANAVGIYLDAFGLKRLCELLDSALPSHGRGFREETFPWFQPSEISSVVFQLRTLDQSITAVRACGGEAGYSPHGSARSRESTGTRGQV